MALRPLNVLSFCAGVGGLELGVRIAEPRARCIVHVEREAAAAASLVASMEAGWFHPAPVWSDAGSFDARPWRGLVHCVASGDPCQPNSVAGRGLGSADDRWLIDQLLRVVDECRPHRLFRENVPGNLDGQLAALVPSLERMGYRVACGIFSASEVGASHRRERFFLMADCIDGGQPEQPQQHGWAIGGCAGDGADCGYALRRDHHEVALRSVADTDVARSPLGPRPEVGRGALGQERPAAGVRGDVLADASMREQWRSRQWRAGERPEQLPPGGHGSGFPAFAPGPADGRWPKILARAPHLEPAVRRVAHGMAGRIERLRACGNGVVPLAAAHAWASLSASLAADAAGSGAAAMRVAA